ncbi:MAG TPA: indolepyruvate ferredoxin oxidoreductase family protein [Caldilineaceae bacterium]|nr:indolepyruvate ferredoxin oxidoreductase family protein [Caldilineaceae bacterium]
MLHPLIKPLERPVFPTTAPSQPRAFTLDDKYCLEEGTILLTGIQALVRLPLDQHRADRRRGLNTATFISGYRGSPLGGLDIALQRAQPLLADHQVVFLPGVNEELGATAVWGSQLAHRLPNKPKVDGVLGMWYGKAPGVDRSGDALKHANFTGVGRYGGVLAVAGDDPIAKSSTLPSHSEVALYDAQMPILYPGSIQEVLDLGRLGFELSRYSGCWVGFKIVTDIADGFGTAEVAPERIAIRDPGFLFDGQPWRPTQNPFLLAPHSLRLERELVEGRLAAAKAFAAANGLNRISVPTPDAWLGIVAAGKTYYDLREALSLLGLEEPELRRYGIRLLKLDMIYPLEPAIINNFARGLEEIFVVEEKRSFIELFIRDLLYDHPDHPRIVGKRDERGDTLVPAHGELDADQIARLLARRLSGRISADSIAARLARIQVALQPVEPAIPLHTGPPPAEQTEPARTPYFCSGCPHNRSLPAPEGSLVGAGIGCHTMILLMDREDVTGITQMGGEGVQWVGAAPFTEAPHFFQNLGDGTLFHSGSLAIRQAVAANANITYKILYNSAVAMTGGQPADGGLSPPALTRLLEAEGVKRILVVADDPHKYAPGERWADGVEVWPRERLDEAQRLLRATPGVTALIYDQECAANLRRKRKRGQAPDPPRQVFINEAVCEGCGDCGVKSNCLSVLPVETEFGRKTQIHWSSCNQDYTCLEGDCPSFLTVVPDRAHREGLAAQPALQMPLDMAPARLPMPRPRAMPDGSLYNHNYNIYNIYMVGIGGTGVVSANQILGTAALLDGKQVVGLDQTGLSQKGGPVASSLKLLDRPQDLSNRVTAGEADLYLVFDLLGGTAAAQLSRALPDKTVAVVSTSLIPPGKMIRSPDVQLPDRERLKARIERRTQAEENLYLDATALAEKLLGSHMPANLIVIGAAFQAGLIPLSASAIERAITLNGVAVEVNLQAFRAGRRAVADPAWLESLALRRPGALTIAPPLTSEALALIEEVGAVGELRRLLEIRVPELIAYQDLEYARAYVALIKQVYTAEQQLIAPQTRLSEAVARNLFKLMAYKDEYEVARLHLRPEVRQALVEQFGPAARLHYHLHPPLLRALGLRRKVVLGKWFDPFLRLLTRLKGLRGTPFDPFGYTHVRRVERALIGEYRTMVQEAIAALRPENYELAVRLAALPDLVRGYESIKLRNIERFRREAQQLRQELTQPAAA